MPSTYNTSGAFRLEAPSDDARAAMWSFTLETGTCCGLPVPGSAAGASRPLLASIAAHLAGHIPGDVTRRPTPNLLCTIATAAQPGIQLKVIRIQGDGKCMFRAIAIGLARNQGRLLAGDIERREADNLRMAVAEALCRTDKRRKQFGQAVRALQQEDSLKNYCKRLASPTFWGGEPEMMVLSDMLKVPIFVYLSESEYGGKGGFTCIQKFGERYRKPTKDGRGRRPVRLLFTGNNHFDLLVKT